jgi:hypothetical protein
MADPSGARNGIEQIFTGLRPNHYGRHDPWKRSWRFFAPVHSEYRVHDPTQRKSIGAPNGLNGLPRPLEVGSGATPNNNRAYGFVMGSILMTAGVTSAGIAQEGNIPQASPKRYGVPLTIPHSVQ